MLILLFLVLTSLYVTGIGYLLNHWLRIPRVKAQKEVFPSGLELSVVIVVRNEQENIVELLNDLEGQSLAKSAFEVLVVNDHSTDSTCSLIQELAPRLSFQLKLFHLSELGKKAGLELGIRKAAGRIIAVTDGDCRLSKDWLLSILNSFLYNKAVFVSGPVTFSAERNLFQKIQTVEFASLVGSGAALLRAGKPGMCNAANMAFLKEAFEQVNAFQANRHIPSGDDEFLLQAIYRQFPGKVHYLKNSSAVVRTRAQESWADFYQQRKRWAGKWRLHKNPWIALTAGGVFIFHASWVLLLISILMSLSWKTSLLWVPSVGFFFAAVLIKFWSEYLFLQIVLESMNKKLLLLPFLVLQLLYPFYVVFFGIAVNFGSFSWKGRTYKYTNT